MKGKGNFVADINRLLPKRQQDFFIEMDALLETLPGLDIRQEELISHIEKYYKKLGGQADD